MTPPHGEARNVNPGCRCAVCRTASAKAAARYQAKRRAAVAAGTMPVPHGTANGYVNYGCRCAECRTAYAAYRRRRVALRETS